MAYQHRQKRRAWFVYGLYDARDRSRPFYIGMTYDMEQRARQHRYNKTHLAGPHVRRILGAGSRCVLRSLACFKDRGDALIYERMTIARTPGLLNRADDKVLMLAKVLNNDFAFQPHDAVEVVLPMRLRPHFMDPVHRTAIDKRAADRAALKEQRRLERAANFVARRKKRLDNLCR
jgi:predicted GIY-YIG superfamily endonuclease